MITKIYPIHFGNVEEGGSTRCIHAKYETARTHALEMVAEQNKKLSDHIASLLKKHHEDVLNAYKEEDGSWKTWKETHKDYWTNSFDCIIISEMELLP